MYSKSMFLIERYPWLTDLEVLSFFTSVLYRSGELYICEGFAGNLWYIRTAFTFTRRN
jgi:hypothetical protein